MGIEDFITEEKTSSPKDKASGNDKTVEDFIDDKEDDSLEVEGGFTIESLEEENIDTEVVKIFGGPGTGKTTTIIGNTDIDNYSGIIEQMVNDGRAENIMLLAYTRAAADEAKDRLTKLTDITKSKADNRVTTIHSIVMQKNNLGPQDIVEIRWNNDENDFCNEVGLAYDPRGGDDEDQMMSTPDDEGHLFFKMNSWLKSKMKPWSEWRDCPLSSEWDRSGDDFVELCDEWEKFKNQRGLWEFDDAILASVNKEHTLDTQELFIDEVQDLYPLQQQFIDNQIGHVQRLYLAGDDDQCLPPTAPVELRDEHGSVVQKEIQNVEVGDKVQTMYGGGDYGYQRVTDVTVKEVVNKCFKTFTTESGKELTVTDNHKLFARIPEADYNNVSDAHYVYLMRDDSNRWRIGETDNLHQRLNVERNARCIVPIEVCNTREDALLKEAQYSLNYSIPTTSFTQRQGEVLSEENAKSRLYDNIEMGLVALQSDLGVDLSKPPLFKKATTRGRTESLNLNINMCSDVRNAYIGHKLEIHTSNKEYVEELQNLDILNSTQRRGDNWRFRKTSSDLSMLGNLAEHIQEELSSDIITQMKSTESRKNAYVVPAKNVVNGMLLPVFEGEEVVFEEVVEVNEFHDTTEVYDLTVKGTHNFSSNQIFCHNTIYEWAGAKPEYFLDMEAEIHDKKDKIWEDKSGHWADNGTYILDQSWRMPSEILELAKMTIEQVDSRQEKEIKPHHDGGEFIPLHKPDPERVIKLINPDDTMVLFRAKYQMNNFGQELISAGVPYKDRFKTWRSNIVALRDGLAALKNDENTMSGKSAERIMTEMPKEAFKSGVSRSKWENKYSSRQSVPTDHVLDHFRLSRPDSYAKINRWCNDFEEANYYQGEAVKYNLAQHNEHMMPEGLNIRTIHGSKGREADTVILSTDTTQSVQENMVGESISDAERRLYYVGLTRTQNRLVLCEGLDSDSPEITIDEIIGEEWREDYEFVNGPVREVPDN